MVNKENFFIRYRFQIIIGGIFLAGLVFISIYIIHNELYKPDNLFNELKDKDSPLYLRNVIIGIAALATAFFTWWKNVLNAKQVETTREQTKNTQIQLDHIQKQILIQEESRLDSLFAKAVDFLREENDLITRIGGVHTLKDLAISSPKHTQKCIDMLCSLNETWMPDMIEQYPGFFNIDNDWVNKKINNELLSKNLIFIVQTQNELFESRQNKLVEKISLSQPVIKSILSIIQHVNEKNPDLKIDLSYKYLCSINLSKLNLSNFKMLGTFLNGANLSESNIQETELSNANLQYAYLVRANFQKTKLHSTNLKNTKLYEANFEESELNSAILDGARLDYANFQGATLFAASFLFCQLYKTNFQGAELFCADLRGTNIEETILCGANLTNTDIQGALLKNTLFDYAVFFNTLLFGSEIYLTKKQIIYYTKDFLSSDLYFKKKDEDEFRKNIESNIDEELKSSFSDEYNKYINRMLTSYSKQNKMKELNYEDLFTLYSEPDEEFIQKRNNFAVQNKSIAKCMLKHEYSIFRDTINIINILNMKLIEYLNVNKSEWYEEFKKDGIIREDK
jgi:uncharacterized protein YjbI with pentapeptide repeats